MNPRSLLILIPSALAGFFTMKGIQRSREKALASLWYELDRPSRGGVFDPYMVDGLPEPARRWLLRSIAPGTPLCYTARLSMRGSIRLKPDAGAIPMKAEQILAPPRGFIWKAHVGKGLMRISGFDRWARGTGMVRWWLYGLVPVVKGEGNDVDRSAAGRLAGEAMLVPASLLPGNGVRWEAIDDHSARFFMTVGNEEIATTIETDEEGRLKRVSIRRWKDDAGNGKPGYARFDVDHWGGERTFDGYTIPTRFRAGWQLGDPGEYPFFYAAIDEISYR